MTPAKQIFSLVLFALIFAVFAWVAGVPAAKALIHQYQAQSFPKTEGHILSGEIVTSRGSKGSVYYHPHFLYSYELDGHTYRAARYRYDGYPSDYASVSQIVRDRPAGAMVDVYYNPIDPSDSVLSPMVVGRDVSSLFLFGPLPLVILFFILRSWQMEWFGKGSPVAGGVKIINEMMVTRVRLPRYQPITLGLLTAGILSFAAGIVFLIPSSLSPVPAGVFAAVLMTVAGASVYLWQYQKIASGLQDLVIHPGAQTIELPLTYKRRERRPVPISEIKAVTLEMVEHKSRNGVFYSYAPTLELRDGSSEKLTDLSEARADSLATWLREKLGVQG